MTPLRAWALAGAAALGLTYACGLDTGPSNEIAVRSVTVSPDSATLSAPGATQQFTAIAWDSAGEPIPNARLVWESTNILVATVDATGLATAGTNGRAGIVADAGLASDTATLSVVQPKQSPRRAR